MAGGRRFGKRAAAARNAANCANSFIIRDGGEKAGKGYVEAGVSPTNDTDSPSATVSKVTTDTGMKSYGFDPLLGKSANSKQPTRGANGRTCSQMPITDLDLLSPSNSIARATLPSFVPIFLSHTNLHCTEIFLLTFYAKTGRIVPIEACERASIAGRQVGRPVMSSDGKQLQLLGPDVIQFWLYTNTLEQEL